MIFPPIFELSLVGLYDAGIPNRERIVIRPTEKVNLAQFGIILAFRNPNGMTTPIRDNFFWFGELEISPPSWIVVATSEGKYDLLKDPVGGQDIHMFHWGRKTTIFNRPEFAPILIQLSSIVIGNRQISAPVKA